MAWRFRLEVILKADDNVINDKEPKKVAASDTEKYEK